MGIIIPCEFNPQSQPLSGSGYYLNQYHPMNRDLRVWLLGNERCNYTGVLRDLVMNIGFTPNGNPTWAYDTLTIGTSSRRYAPWFGSMINLARATSQYLSASDCDWLDITGPLTIACSVRGSSYGYYAFNNGLVAKYLGSGNQRSYSLIIDYQTNGFSPAFAFQVSSDGSSAGVKVIRGSTVLSTDATRLRYRVAAVYVPSTSLTLYVDGIQDGQNTTSIPASIYSSSADLWIGEQFSTSSNNMFDGMINNVQIWSRALTSKEIYEDFEFPYGKPMEPRILTPFYEIGLSFPKSILLRSSFLPVYERYLSLNLR